MERTREFKNYYYDRILCGRTGNGDRRMEDDGKDDRTWDYDRRSGASFVGAYDLQ